MTSMYVDLTNFRIFHAKQTERRSTYENTNWNGASPNLQSLVPPLL